MATLPMRAAPTPSGRGSGSAFPFAGLLLGVLGVASAAAAISGQAGLIVGLIIASGIAAFVVRNPFFAVCIYLLTFLLTYPPALRGFILGNITINNVLGLLLLPIVFWGTLRDGPAWLLRSLPLLIMVPIAFILLTSGTLYNREVKGATGELVQTRQEEARGRRPQERIIAGVQFIRTGDVRVRFITRYVFLLFFVFFVRTPQQLRAVVMVLIGVLMMTTFSLTTEAGEAGWGRGRLRVQGGTAGVALFTGTNPNKLAFYSQMCLALLWYARTQMRSSGKFLVWAVCSAIALAIIPLTASRSAFINLNVFFAILFLQGRMNAQRIAALSLLATIAVAQLGYNYNVLDLFLPPEASTRLTRLGPGPQGLLRAGETTVGSFQRRAGVFFDALDMVPRAGLFGFGMGNFARVRAIVDPTAEVGPPHNSYLSAATEGGLVTLALYLILYGWILVKLNDILRDYAGRFGPVDLEWLAQGMRTVLILFLVYSFFADIWVHIYFHIVVGLALAVIQIHRVYAETGHVPGTSIGPPPATEGSAV